MERLFCGGFGMMCSTKNDGLFLGRHAFEPKLLKVNSLLSNIWEPNQISYGISPKTKKETLLMLQLLVKSIKWLENYENWVLIRCGESYRNESLQGMNSNGVPPIRLDKKWHELSERFTKINSKILQIFD